MTRGLRRGGERIEARESREKNMHIPSREKEKIREAKEEREGESRGEVAEDESCEEAAGSFLSYSCKCLEPLGTYTEKGGVVYARGGTGVLIFLANL